MLMYICHFYLILFLTLQKITNNFKRCLKADEFINKLCNEHQIIFITTDYNNVFTNLKRLKLQNYFPLWPTTNMFSCSESKSFISRPVISAWVTLTCSYAQPGLCEQISFGLSTPFPWQPEDQTQSGLSLLDSVKDKEFVKTKKERSKDKTCNGVNRASSQSPQFNLPCS